MCTWKHKQEYIYNTDKMENNKCPHSGEKINYGSQTINTYFWENEPQLHTHINMDESFKNGD